MNDKFSKLRQEQRQEANQEQAQKLNSEAQQFGSVEEMLRADAANTVVPRNVAEKLNRSLGKETPPSTSWWKRLFGK